MNKTRVVELLVPLVLLFEQAPKLVHPRQLGGGSSRHFVACNLARREGRAVVPLRKKDQGSKLKGQEAGPGSL